MNESQDNCFHKSICSYGHSIRYLLSLMYLLHLLLTFQTKHHVYGGIIDANTEETVWSVIEGPSSRQVGISGEERLWTNVENAKGKFHFHYMYIPYMYIVYMYIV